jgi:hypothetical protein
MTKLAKNLLSVSYITGALLSGPALAANSIQEAVDEEQANVQTQEVFEAPAKITKSTQWYSAAHKPQA